jgi:nucleotide-binding universal stress UspA family protein
MAKTFLVGLHGTQYAQAAMELALALAQRQGAMVLGLGVVDLPHLTAPQPLPPGAGAFKEARDQAVVEHARRQIEQVLETFSRRAGELQVPVQTEIHEGDPPLVLAHQAQRVDLVVVGKKHRPREEWERGSQTLEQLLRHTPRPVLCVPVARSDLARVLLAYDGSLEAARTLLAFVHSGIAPAGPIELVALGTAAQAAAPLAAEFLQSHGWQPRLHAEPAAHHVGMRILELARACDAGLVVMGSAGQGRVKEFFFGSATREVLGETEVPLFLFH